jgi:hypothetical protein
MVDYRAAVAEDQCPAMEPKDGRANAITGQPIDIRFERRPIHSFVRVRLLVGD